MLGSNSKSTQEMCNREAGSIIETGCSGACVAKPSSGRKYAERIKELERELRRKDKLLMEREETIEILKKSRHIFMEHQG